MFVLLSSLHILLQIFQKHTELLMKICHPKLLYSSFIICTFIDRTLSRVLLSGRPSASVTVCLYVDIPRDSAFCSSFIKM
jgi:hypothetical protein